MLTYVLDYKFAHVITLFRNRKKTTHIFDDHYLTFHMFYENDSEVHYIIANDYGTDEKIFLWLNKNEVNTLKRELKRVEGVSYGIRDSEGRFFKKALAVYIKAFTNEWSSQQRTHRDAKTILALTAA